MGVYLNFKFMVFFFPSEHTESCKVLTDLRIWHESALPGGLLGWKLNDIFRQNLRIALLGG